MSSIRNVDFMSIHDHANKLGASAAEHSVRTSAAPSKPATANTQLNLYFARREPRIEDGVDMALVQIYRTKTPVHEGQQARLSKVGALPTTGETVGYYDVVDFNSMPGLVLVTTITRIFRNNTWHEGKTFEPRFYRA